MFVFSARFSQIQLQQLFTSKESIVLKSLPAVVVLSYFTASEKENLRTERKQNQEMKNEKREKISDSYYLSNRKVIKVVCSSRISLLAFWEALALRFFDKKPRIKLVLFQSSSLSICSSFCILLCYLYLLFIP